MSNFLGDFIGALMAIFILILLVFIALAMIGMIISVPIGVAAVLLKLFGVI